MAKRFGKRKPGLPDGMQNSLVDKYGRPIDDGYNYDEPDEEEETEPAAGPLPASRRREDPVVGRYSSLSASERASMADEAFSEIAREANEAGNDFELG